MDFLPKTANLQGGDTRKTPQNTEFSKSRHTPRGQGSLCVFGLERIGRVWRDLVDLEGVAWGGPLPLIGLA